jgi:hypothetical protein
MASDLTGGVLAALGHLVLHYEGDGSFRMRGAVPEWTTGRLAVTAHAPIHVLMLMESFPFLETTLTNLDRLWVDTRDRIKVLGEWVEMDGEAKEIHLRAALLTLQDARLLILSSVDQGTIDLIRRARAMIAEK